MTNQGHEQFSRAGDQKMDKNKHAHEKSPRHIYTY